MISTSSRSSKPSSEKLGDRYMGWENPRCAFAALARWASEEGGGKSRGMREVLIFFVVVTDRGHCGMPQMAHWDSRYQGVPKRKRVYEYLLPAAFGLANGGLFSFVTTETSDPSSHTSSFSGFYTALQLGSASVGLCKVRVPKKKRELEIPGKQDRRQSIRHVLLALCDGGGPLE
ncbi:uncharacterized protein LAESUDRAFT_379083 [Laetiporus sulphureus 93-53]|uniref:Uncharacterized protein n=1 Tax=Laetiporus sulphureus 93-53 TaxID=1314785 RepID=A0A165CQB8_9APHY|nr:uncharacterized protein LAESUDRAFT_379083 [Laetiporus sulphureus 93-53]KZT03229.1 hypothetical protein LAESUDRAFT_379083 [Laetiporus sulphureus 93-53]